MKPLLVGESNPHNADPRLALYPLPEHLSGGRLATVIMGLSRGDYLRRFDRVNLCSGRWCRLTAASRATALIQEERPVYVLLGAKVAGAFGVTFNPFDACSIGGTGFKGKRRLVLLPHPSGRCRVWNELNAYERARQLLRDEGVL